MSASNEDWCARCNRKVGPPSSNTESLWAGLLVFVLILGWPLLLHFLAVGD